MAKRSTERLEWTNVNVDTMPPKLKKMYAEYRRLNKIAIDARNAFNAALTQSMNGKTVPPDDLENPELVIGHGFGKLSFAWRSQRQRRQAGEFSFDD